MTDALIASDGRLAPFELLVRVLLRRRLRPEQTVGTIPLEQAVATVLLVLERLDRSLDPIPGRLPHNRALTSSAAAASAAAVRPMDLDAALETLQSLPPLRKPAIVRDWLKWSWSAQHRDDARAVLARLAAVLDTPFLIPDREPPG